MYLLVYTLQSIRSSQTSRLIEHSMASCVLASGVTVPHMDFRRGLLLSSGMSSL